MSHASVIPQRHQVERALAHIASRLRTLRRTAGLTLHEVASLTGIGASTLSRLEAGRRRPSLELLIPLAAAYGTWFGAAGDRPAEVLLLSGADGEQLRMRVRALG